MPGNGSLRDALGKTQMPPPTICLVAGGIPYRWGDAAIRSPPLSDGCPRSLSEKKQRPCPPRPREAQRSHTALTCGRFPTITGGNGQE